MKNYTRRRFVAATASVAGVAFMGRANAQSFPSERFNLTCGYSPGGLADTTARIVGGYLGRTFPEPAIVLNKPGANGALAWEAISQEEPNGYNLLISTQSQVVLLPATTPSLNLDPIKGLSHISTLIESPYLLWANPKFEAETFDDLVRIAKSKETPIFYGTSGIGGQQHLATELMALETGIELQPIHYKGGGAMMPDLITNRIQIGFGTPSLAMSAFKEGQVRPLLVVGETRDPNFPDIACSTEVGIPKLKAILGWYGVDGPAGISDEVSENLNAIVADCVADPEVKAAFENQQVRILPVSREEYRDRISREYETIKDLAKAIKFSG